MISIRAAKKHEYIWLIYSVISTFKTTMKTRGKHKEKTKSIIESFAYSFMISGNRLNKLNSH
jgi:hypothetical protein